LIEQGDEIVANGRLLDLIRRVRTFGISPSVVGRVGGLEGLGLSSLDGMITPKIGQEIFGGCTLKTPISK